MRMQLALRRRAGGGVRASMRRPPPARGEAALAAGGRVYDLVPPCFHSHSDAHDSSVRGAHWGPGVPCAAISNSGSSERPSTLSQSHGHGVESRFLSRRAVRFSFRCVPPVSSGLRASAQAAIFVLFPLRSAS